MKRVIYTIIKKIDSKNGVREVEIYRGASKEHRDREIKKLSISATKQESFLPNTEIKKVRQKTNF
jgi:hypothetical protein